MMSDLYMPLHAMRLFNAAIDLATREQTTVAELAGSPTAIGYVPVYASLADLIRQHGDVEYTILRRSLPDKEATS